MKNPSIKTALIAASAFLLPVSAASAQDTTQVTVGSNDTSSATPPPSTPSDSEAIQAPFISVFEARKLVSSAFADQGKDLTDPNIKKEARGILKECRREFNINNMAFAFMQPYSASCLNSKLGQPITHTGQIPSQP